MGQRTATETLFGIIAAFIERRTWTQADLAKRMETSTATIRKRLTELQAAGYKLERSEDHPHVYWSVPKNWFPGAVAFKPNEVDDLLRVLSRAPRGPRRDRVLAVLVERLANLGSTAAQPFDPSAVQSQTVDPNVEEHLSRLEDAARKRVPIRLRYFTASRGDESSRDVSVHRIDLGARPHFIATCHRSNELRRFRVSNVLSASLEEGEAFRKIDASALRKFDEESFGSFRDEGPVVHCAFLVRKPEAIWVARNLPDARIKLEPDADGTRFTVDTAAVTMLARFVAGLGEAAIPETPELSAEVATIAEAALANARRARGPGSSREALTPTQALTS